ncbi:MAG: PQQ-binding-like beta-propeller repeat protein, partial [Candidatus Latescibacteria bacterium]|nr:PQQ-binding-like beta-propeller repeat protein [Candidatus Latescibacterota bacterium]
MNYLSILCLLAIGLNNARATEDPAHWPHWRGPLQNGVSPQAAPPLSWSEELNMRWKVDLPGQGHASPIIWGDKLFITSAVAHGPVIATADSVDENLPSWRRGNKADRVLAFQLLAFDRHSGELLWQRTARTEKPHEGTHTDGTWASNSSVTDGQHIYAYFGSRGLYCYTLDGDLVWERDLGDMQTRFSFGEGSSPVIHGDKIALLWDHEGASAVYVLDKNTGATLWQADRDEATSWSTPLVVEYADRPQLITGLLQKSGEGKMVHNLCDLPFSIRCLLNGPGQRLAQDLFGN